MDEILDGRLYVGTVDVSENKEMLAQAGITHIINAAYSVPCLFPETFEYLPIPALDLMGYDLLSNISACINFYNKAISEERPTKVLVHCIAGVSRSGAIATAIVMYSKRISYEDALQFVKTKRPCIQPNPGFAAQLKTWWLKWYENLT